MSGEQAELYLRQLAEAELRQRARDRDQVDRAWYTPTLELAAQALTTAGAIDAATAAQVRAEADLAVAARHPREPGAPPPTRRLNLPVPPLAAAQPPVAPASWRVVPVGQVIPGSAPGGDVTVLAYLGGPAGARFAIVGGMPGFPGQLTATDDQGTRYHLRLMRGPRVGVLELFPPPAHPIRRLDVITASGGIAARIDLDAAAQHRPQPRVTVTQTDTSPGELMLDVIAARILTIGPLPPARPEAPDGASRGLCAFIGSRPGDITAAMMAAGALPEASPLPGQLAALCERLGIRGHGIAAPPAAELPEPWESMLSPRGEHADLAPGRWAMAVAEPVLGGLRRTILGLDHAVAGTILHSLVRGATVDDDWAFSRGVRPLHSLWIRDSGGGWHATRTSGILPWADAGLVMLSQAIVPALPSGTAWIDVVTSVPGAQAQVRLPLGVSSGPPSRSGPLVWGH